MTAAEWRSYCGKLHGGMSATEARIIDDLEEARKLLARCLPVLRAVLASARELGCTCKTDALWHESGCPAPLRQIAEDMLDWNTRGLGPDDEMDPCDRAADDYFRAHPIYPNEEARELMALIEEVKACAGEKTTQEGI